MTAHSSQYPEASSPSSPSVAPDPRDSSPGLGVLLLDPREALKASLAGMAAADCLPLGPLTCVRASPALPAGFMVNMRVARLLHGCSHSPDVAPASQPPVCLTSQQLRVSHDSPACLQRGRRPPLRWPPPPPDRRAWSHTGRAGPPPTPHWALRRAFLCLPFSCPRATIYTPVSSRHLGHKACRIA
jgi:hypothetical protein